MRLGQAFDELDTRMKQAMVSLNKLMEEAQTSDSQKRLKGKIEGVQLAHSYLVDENRVMKGFRPQHIIIDELAEFVENEKKEQNDG